MAKVLLPESVRNNIEDLKKGFSVDPFQILQLGCEAKMLEETLEALLQHFSFWPNMQCELRQAAQLMRPMR